MDSYIFVFMVFVLKKTEVLIPPLYKKNCDSVSFQSNNIFYDSFKSVEFGNKQIISVLIV